MLLTGWNLADAIAVAREEELFAYLRQGHSLDEAEKRFRRSSKSKTRAN